MRRARLPRLVPMACDARDQLARDRRARLTGDARSDSRETEELPLASRLEQS